MHVSRGRRGFTAVEAVIAIVLFGLVAETLLGLLTASQRLFRSQAERAALQSTVRAGAQLLPAELRGLSGSDLVAIAPDQLTYRATRLTAVACRVTPASVTLRLRLMYAYRSVTPGRDSLLLFVEGNVSRSDDDRWQAVPVTGVPAGAACPDGAAAPAVPAVVPPAAISASPAVPVRGFEVVQLRLYQSGGQYWLGSQSISGGEAQIQPALGPLAADGVRLAYARADGSSTANPADVAFVRLTLRGLTDGAVRAVGGALAVAADSATTSVTLRNAE